MTEDAEAIMNRLRVNAPHLAPGIDAAQRRVAEQKVAKQLLEVDRAAKEAAWARRTPSLEHEHQRDLARNGGGYAIDYPDHEGPINGELMIGRGTSLSIWLDNQRCEGVLKAMPLNRTFYLTFEGLEKPVGDRLFNSYQNGEHIAFARLISNVFVNEARKDNDTFGPRDFARRFQASTVHTSKYDADSIVRNEFVRLYWNDGAPVKAIIMDGEKPTEIKLHGVAGTKWDSPTHRGEV